MDSIGFLEIIALIGLIIYIYLFSKEFNRGKYLGRLIFHVPKDFNIKASIFFWSLLGCFWIFNLILRLVDLNIYTEMNFLRNLMAPVLLLIMCLYKILECINDKEIREKGVIIKEGGIVFWKDIIYYEWIKDGELKIVFKPDFRFALNKKAIKIWTINPEDKEKVDTIFRGYLNIEKQY